MCLLIGRRTGRGFILLMNLNRFKLPNELQRRECSRSRYQTLANGSKAAVSRSFLIITSFYVSTSFRGIRT